MNFDYDIKRYVRNEDYLKGRRFPPYYIKLYKRQIRNNEIILLYKVESERTYKEYDVVVSTSNHELVGHGCTCSRYKEAHSCKHVAAVLINHYNDIIKFTPKDLLKNLSMNIIDSFEEIDNKGNIKEELGLEIEINPSGYQSNVTVKIGKDKKYVLKNKIHNFLGVYNSQNGAVEFGKSFTYDPKKHYFNYSNEKIIKYLDNYFRYHNSFYFEDEDLKTFINLIKDRPFFIDGIGAIYEIKEENPFESKITKNNDLYELSINYDNIYPLTSDFEYIIKDRNLYKIDKKMANLILKLKQMGMNSLYFDEENINNFSKRVLPIIKENVTVDENIDNIIVVKKPDCKLYFDLNYNDIVCNVKLIYGNVELDYFDNDNKVLRDYQEVGVKWLYNIYKCGFGGILADEMGLGKSVQIIYLIKKLLKEDKDSKYLIVAPTSLVYNWENEFKKFAPDIKYETFGDTKNIRHEKLDKDNPSVYITSYGLLREDYEYYKDIKFNVCIIDEAQNIKNPNAEITKTLKSINANTKFALTGTPIENSAVELWSIFDFCMDGFLGEQQEFGKKYSVKDFDEDTNKKLQNLNKLISPFVLRRRKVDVLKDLPEKLENNIYIDLSDSQKKLYAKEVERVNKELDNIIHTEGISKARFLILQLLVKLRQLCIDPRIVYENYKDGSNKIDTLINVVKEYVSNGHKILLFTSFRTALDLVRKEFNKNCITSYTIDGSVSSKKRMELVAKFNSDDTNVFLIMLKSGGTGLNLTSADVVIHLDLWWNPQAESQATDRAHRIGQRNNVEVIKLVSKGTIEEKILELQSKKKKLSDKVIEGEDMDKNVISKLTEKELKELLSYEQKK